MKFLLILSIIVLSVSLYLNRVYGHIYSTIGTNNLANPTIRQVSSITAVSAAGNKKITYVALGDSLTAGVGASAEDKTYPYQVAKLLAETQNAQVTIVNLAWPGATAADVLQNQVPLVAQFHPDIITVAIGINDMHNKVPADTFQETISTIIDKLATTTKHLNIINIPFIGDKSLFLPPYRWYFDRQTKRYNAWLRDALVQHTTWIDLYSLTRAKALAEHTYYSADNFHPSDEGYNFWSKVLYDHLDY
jgi:acyl-CoA thioesterase-1